MANDADTYTLHGFVRCNKKVDYRLTKLASIVVKPCMIVIEYIIILIISGFGMTNGTSRCSGS